MTKLIKTFSHILKTALLVGFVSLPAHSANVIQTGVNPSLKMIVYGDYQCPFTALLLPVIEQLRTEYGDKLAIYFSHFPLSFHDQAVTASIAAICADEQGLFWDYSKNLLQNQAALADDYYLRTATTLSIKDPARFEACMKEPRVKSQVELEYLVGEAHGVSGTPNTWINGELISGAYPYSHFKEIIDRKLAE